MDDSSASSGEAGASRAGSAGRPSATDSADGRSTGVAHAGSSSGGASAANGAGGTPSPTASDSIAFTQRVVVDALGGPWEISWGPDSFLWLTERTGKRVLRINPSDGTRHVAVQIDEVRQDGSQDGLLGMALHPQLLTGKNQDYVFVAYSYDDASGRRFKIRRYTYDAASETLAAPLDILTGLPASSDHNAGRLLIGPDQKLYYTIGDQGADQLEHYCEPNRAQELPSAAQISARDYQAYRGKILRINLDGSIPSDNPTLNGVQSHVMSYGHRNAQGIAFSAAGVLYSDEQGPKSDDEVNRIESGKNYGWPNVAGYQDDKAYVFANWSAAANCTSLSFSDYTIPADVPQQKESEWSNPNFVPPLQTFYTVESDYNFKNPKCGGSANICWPTIAPSSLEVYPGGAHALAGWTESLLVTSLKEGTVYRLPLKADGGLSGETKALFKTTNRYRDLALNPDGHTFYVVTDNEGSTASVDGGATSSLQNKGSILEFHAP